MKEAVVKSWQTTLAGLGQFMAVLGTALSAQFDQDAATDPAWGLVVASGIAMFGLVFARDNGVTSEEAKGKPRILEPVAVAPSEEEQDNE